MRGVDPIPSLTLRSQQYVSMRCAPSDVAQTSSRRSRPKSRGSRLSVRRLCAIATADLAADTTLTEAQQEEFRSFSWSSPFALAS